MKCFFANFTLFLYDYGFGYLCFALLFIIVIISLFGKIKADYRWFILNQAIWDIAITYGYLRSDGIYKYLEYGSVVATWNWQTAYVLEFLNDIIDTNPYTSLLLLSWSRFLALYYPNFYDRITSKKRIFILIIGFNFTVCFFHISALTNKILSETRTRLNLYCLKNKMSGNCQEWYESQLLYIFLLILYNVFRFIVLLKPIIFLCLSIFAAIMIIVKIGRQAKFQLKHNRRDFFVSLRISAVILFQTIINCILVFVEFTESIDDIIKVVFNVVFKKHEPCPEITSYYKGCVDFLQLPEWLDDDQYRLGLEGPTIYPTFKQLRIFLESIIIIAVMAGYREALVKFAKYLFSFVKKPKNSSVNNSVLFVNRSSTDIT